MAPVLRHVVSVKSSEKGTSRHVFEIGHYHAVVKCFESEKPATVKFWDSKMTSLPRTMASWNTKEKYVPDVATLDVMKNFVTVLISRLSG